MTKDVTVRLLNHSPHGDASGHTPPVRFEGVTVGGEPLIQLENYEFHDCDISHLEGESFSECVFRNCSFRSTDLHCVYFWSCEFIDCVFTDASWVHVGFREVTFRDCTFLRIKLETGMFITCRFRGVVWDNGSLMCSCFNFCTFDATSFTDAVVNSTFVDCDICEAAFEHIVEPDSQATICLTGGGTPSDSVEDMPIGQGPDPNERKSSTDVEASVRVVTTGRGQDPLDAFRVEGAPTGDQLHQLDELLRTETAEAPFQRFLEQNRELLLVAVELGHHGYYVLSEVRFGAKHRADFMVGAKNSMGHFWTGLEIESPGHKVLKRNGHFTQKVQHAIDQVEEWRTYVRNHRVAMQQPKAHHGEGLTGIEPDFKAWVIIGRDADDQSAKERRAKFLNSDHSIHVQTWDGFRRRVAEAVRRGGRYY